MQPQGLTKFETLEEFRVAFLPAHENYKLEIKSWLDGYQQLPKNEQDFKSNLDELSEILTAIEAYYPQYKRVCLRPLDEDKSTLNDEHTASKVFDRIAQSAKRFGDLSAEFSYCPEIETELKNTSKNIPKDWQEVLQVFSQIRAAEDDFYKAVDLERIDATNKQRELKAEKLRQEQEAKVAADAAAARRKSLQKKLMWTAGFILIVAGFIKTQMA